MKLRVGLKFMVLTTEGTAIFRVGYRDEMERLSGHTATSHHLGECLS